MVQDEAFGLIIGKGELALKVSELANKKNKVINCFLDSHNFYQFKKKFKYAPAFNIGITQISKILNLFKKNNVRRIAMIGYFVKPSWLSFLLADKHFKSLHTKLHEQSATLIGKELIKFVESQGFDVIAADELAPEVRIPEGYYVGNFYEVKDESELGFQFLIINSVFHFAQSVVVKGKRIISSEDHLGTDALINRIKLSRIKDCVLVKCRNRFQDIRFDLPVVGDSTVLALKRAGFKALVVEANTTLTEDLSRLISLCEKYRISFFSVNIQTIEKNYFLDQLNSKIWGSAG